MSPSPAAPAWMPPPEWEAAVGPRWRGGLGEEQVVHSGVWVHTIPTPKEHLSGSTCASPLTPEGMVSS